MPVKSLRGPASERRELKPFAPKLERADGKAPTKLNQLQQPAAAGLKLRQFALRPFEQPIGKVTLKPSPLATAGDRLTGLKLRADDPRYPAQVLAARTDGFRKVTSSAMAETIDEHAERNGYPTTFTALLSNPYRLFGIPLPTRIPNVWAPVLEVSPYFKGVPAPHDLFGIPKDDRPLVEVGKSLKASLSSDEGIALHKEITNAVAKPIDPEDPDGDSVRRWFMFWHLGHILDPQGSWAGELAHLKQQIFNAGSHNFDHLVDSIGSYWSGRPVNSAFKLNIGDPARITDH
jgi:hypothetical protein